MHRPKIYFLLIALLGVAIIVGFWRPWNRKVPAPPISAQEVETIAKDIMALGELYRGPEVNSAVTELVYTREMEGGRGMSRVDLVSGKEERFQHTNQVLRLFGYSPDDRYLIFRDLNRISERLLILDRETGRIRPVKGAKGNLAEVVWLKTNTFAFTYKTGKDVEICLNTISNGVQTVQKIPNTRSITGMVPTSENSVAYVEYGNIWGLDFRTNQSIQLSKLTKADFLQGGKSNKLVSGDFMWLNYSPENGDFMFCSSVESNWRHLYRYTPHPGEKGKLTQLTFEKDLSYNSKWVQQGRGFAYIGNFTNHFYLAVRPENPAENTNFFFGGHVYGFTVSADGTKLFAAASQGVEPPGIFKYDLQNKQLTCVAAGTNTTFRAAQMLPRTEHWVKSFDGLQVPYFLVKPRNLDPSKKYPLVIVVPPEGDQFHNTWENYSQFFGNIGVFHAAVNPRGCDGYGENYSKLGNKMAYEDVYAVYKELVQNPNIDPDRVYLNSYSVGVQTINQLARQHPGLWQGIIIISGFAPLSQQTRGKTPRYFVFVGDRDLEELVEGAKMFSASATQDQIQATLLVGPHTGHVIMDTKVDETLGVQLGKFVLGL